MRFTPQSQRSGWVAPLAIAAILLSPTFGRGEQFGLFGYEVIEGGVEITSYAHDSTEGVTDVVIPAAIDGLAVISIGERAFRACDELTSVIRGQGRCRKICGIPETVTSIGGSAFASCFSLPSVDIPDSITSISSGMFYRCHSLTSIDIPDGVTSVGQDAFYECRSLSSIDIPGGVTSIGSGAFRDCSGLTSLIFPEGITSISSITIAGCTGLTSFVIPSGVTAIGAAVFSGCSGLQSIEIPDGVTLVAKFAFSGCSSLTTFPILPPGVTSIAFGTFKDCVGLTDAVIPDSITEIGVSAFENCSGLSSVIIPGSVSLIRDNAFADCASLNKFYVGGTPVADATTFTNHHPELTIYYPHSNGAPFESELPWTSLFRHSLDDSEAPIAQISSVQGGVQILLRPGHGGEIGIEYSPDMSPGSWVDSGNFQPQGDPGDSWVAFDPNAGLQESGFYRAFIRSAD